MMPMPQRFLPTRPWLKQSIAIAILAILTAIAAPATVGMRSALAEAPVRLVFATELPPLSFEEAGRVGGILIDVAREVFTKRLGQPVDAALYPWERAQQMVRSGKADGFITIATAERAVFTDCGHIPVLRAPLHPIVRRDHPRRAEIEAARTLADLRRFNVISYFGNGWAKQNLAGFDVFYAADFQGSLRGLAQGRGDLGLVTTIAGPYHLRELDLEDKLIILPMVVDTFEYVLCLRKDSPHVAQLPEFERVLDVMRTDGGYAQILEHYGVKADAFY